MGDFTHHEPRVGCTCMTCQLISMCGVPADDPMWAEIELYVAMREAMYWLTEAEPLIGSVHGPWCGERPWLQIWGRALDFGDGANGDAR